MALGLSVSFRQCSVLILSSCFCFQDKWKKPGSLRLFRKKTVVPFSLPSFPFLCLYFCLFVVFYYFLPLSVSALLFASLFHFLSYHPACCISPAGKMSSILLHSMSFCILYHRMVKQLRHETHIFVLRGKSPCFTSMNVAELSNCYQLHCIPTHFLALSSVTITLYINAHETSFGGSYYYAAVCNEQRRTVLANQWHAAFTVVPLYFYFFCPTSVYIYVYIYTYLTP